MLKIKAQKSSTLSFNKTVALIKENDATMLKEVYIANFYKVKRYVLKNRGSEQQAREIYQEAFLAMWRNVKNDRFSAESETTINGYIYQIAKNKWRNHLRSLRYKNTTFINRDIEFDESETEENESQARKIKLIMDSLNQLAERCQLLLKLFYFQRKSYKEIAQIMVMDEVSARNAKYGCQEQLKKMTQDIPARNKKTQKCQETRELIDSYLLGRLDNAQLESFNVRLKTDPEFLKMLEAQKAVARGVEEHNLRKSLDDYHAEIVEEPEKKWLTPGLLALSASILLLIGVSTWAIFFTGNSAQKVFAENFTPDPGLPTKMGTASQYEFYYGMVSYKRKEYAEAISRWEPLYAAHPKNDTLVYFLGLANLANGNARQAENYLKLANEKTESAFSDDIHYYLALAYLKENKIKEAKEILSKSTSSAGIKLLKQVKSL